MLCPVGGRPLLGWALDALVGVVAEVVVNVHHHADVMAEWLGWAIGRKAAVEGGPPSGFWSANVGTSAGLPTGPSLRRFGSLTGWGPPSLGAKAELWASIEGPEALGTAGALGSLAGFLDGRGVLAVNADTVAEADLAEVVAAWDGERPLVAHGGTEGFRPGVPVVASITPWSAIGALPTTPSGLFGHLWSEAHATGALQSLAVGARVLDCGTPRSYLAANLALSGGLTSLEGRGAVEVPSGAQVTRSVLWSGAPVLDGEVLDGVIRTTSGRTVLVRPVPTTA